VQLSQTDIAPYINAKQKRAVLLRSFALTGSSRTTG
jgi:hypothetical protein